MRFFLKVILFGCFAIGVNINAFAKDAVVLLPVQGQGLEVGDKDILRVAIQKGLQQKYQVFSGAEVDKKLKKYAVKTCDAKKCLQEVVIAFQGELVARGVAMKKSGGYILQLEIKNVFEDEVVVTESETCRKCDLFDVVDRFEVMASRGEFVVSKIKRVSLSKSEMKPGDVFRDRLQDGSQGPEMVVIPSGSFRMGDISGSGDDNQKPVHRVTINKPFAMGETEVMRGDFALFVNSTGYRTEAEKGDGCYIYNGEWVLEKNKNWRNPGFDQNNKHPVTCVSWNDAKAYIKWLKNETGKPYRLPSEAEWEYGARAGSNSKYTWGSEVGNGNANCNGCGSRWDNSKTAPVSSFKANGFGLFDMHGNVWEWNEDCWNTSYSGAPSNGKAWTSGECNSRVLRGGSWYGKPGNVRSAYRGGLNSGIGFNNFGFRLAQDL